MVDSRMNLRERATGLEAVGNSRHSARVELGEEWRHLGNPRVPNPDVTLYPGCNEWRRVRTRDVETAPVGAEVIDTETSNRRPLPDKKKLTVSSGEVVALRTGVFVLLRPETDCQLIRTTNATRLSADDEMAVSVGFISRESPETPEQIAVDRTPKSIAAGLSALGCAISPNEPESPARTWPAVRDTPPRLTFNSLNGNEPESIKRPNTDTEIIVPADDALRWLYPTSGLLHYLGAEATVDSTADTAMLRAGSTTWTLGDTPEETDLRASVLLRRIFYLDCHARAAGSHGTELEEHDVLTATGRTADDLYDSPLADRVTTYIDDTDGDTVDEQTPDWHLGIHVDPDLDRAPSLSHHLRRLPDVFLPDAAELTTLGDRAQWGEAQRVRGPSTETPVRESIMVSPDSERSRTVGWDAPHRTLGAFDSGESPPSPRRLNDSPVSIYVVRCSPLYPAQEVIDRYRARETDLPLSVETMGNPTTDDLRRVIESEETDLLHVIAHADDRGIECRDGFLSHDDLTTVKCDAFMLNACESYSFGERMLDLGAVAGAVTTGSVGDNHAATVGADWAGLVSLGWSVERALDFARSVVDPASYVAVGDGTHVVTQSDAPTPPLVDLGSDGTVTIDHLAPRNVGARVFDPFGDDPHLPDRREINTTHDDRKNLAEVMDSAIRHDGRLDWDFSPE